VRGAGGRTIEVVAMTWGGPGAERVYVGRREGPTLLQVEMVHLRRVVELAASLTSGAATATR
jgi:hypothetical protein